MNKNSDNPKVGRNFEIAVLEWFTINHKKSFENNKPIGIGNPPKPHRFDVVSNDNSIIAECKCYTWTETGNISSAKMGFVNEAAFYLSFITDADTFIVMKKSIHPKRAETLAEYYFRTNRHLLGRTKVLEYDEEQKAMKKIGSQ